MVPLPPIFRPYMCVCAYKDACHMSGLTVRLNRLEPCGQFRIMPNTCMMVLWHMMLMRCGQNRADNFTVATCRVSHETLLERAARTEAIVAYHMHVAPREVLGWEQEEEPPAPVLAQLQAVA